MSTGLVQCREIKVHASMLSQIYPLQNKGKVRVSTRTAAVEFNDLQAEELKHASYHLCVHLKSLVCCFVLDHSKDSGRMTLTKLCMMFVRVHTTGTLKKGMLRSTI